MRLLQHACVTLVILGCVARAAAQERIVDELAESPVFFELYSKAYSDPANVDLFREGKIRLHPLGVHIIENFDWRTHTRKDQSWWIRMERFEYMCPIFDSKADLDRAMAKAWVVNWLNIHEQNKQPNQGARDAMGIGMRAMMLARYIRYLEFEEPEERDLIARLRKMMEWHQSFLAQPSHFNTTSNHGLWESMGLFETTRVVPDSAMTMTALKRLMQIVQIGVSGRGLEKEHAVAYHFYFSRWLWQYSEYLQSLDRLRWNDLPALAAAAKRMRDATWYMYDHAGRMPQIGDTDDATVKKVRERRRGADPVMFDPESGYAIYKDPDDTRNHRYVFFCIQNEKNRLPMPHHVHNDMMAVYYSYDGEVILGDGGRYSYSSSVMRRFFQSSSAHNVIMSARFLAISNSSTSLAREVWCEYRKDEVTFGLGFPNMMIKRSVEIPRKKAVVRVRDSLDVGEKHVALWNLGMDVSSFGIGEVTVTDGRRVHTFHLGTRRGQHFIMKLSVSGENRDPNEIEIIKGSEKPLLGWQSPDYNMSWPVPVICVNVDPNGPIEILTEIVRQ